MGFVRLQQSSVSEQKTNFTQTHTKNNTAMRNNNKIFDSDSFRKKRETENFAIRKEKHNSIINKRRNLEGAIGSDDSDYDSDSDVGAQTQNTITPEIAQALPDLMSEDPDKQLASTTSIRRLLSMGNETHCLIFLFIYCFFK